MIGTQRKHGSRQMKIRSSYLRKNLQDNVWRFRLFDLTATVAGCLTVLLKPEFVLIKSTLAQGVKPATS